MTKPHFNTILIITPDSLLESCLAVPAVRAFVAKLGRAQVTVVTTEGLQALWRREVGEVIICGKKMQYSAVEKVVVGRDFGLVMSFYDAPLKRYWANENLLYVMNCPSDRYYGQYIRFPNRRRDLHRVERYLAFPRYFGIDTQRASFYPQRNRGNFSGIFGVYMDSELGASYSNGLDALQSYFGGQLERGVVSLMSYEAEDLTKFEPAYKAKLKNLEQPLAEVMNYLMDLDFIMTPESEIMHLAAYLGVPTVSFFGPGNIDETRPLGRFHELVRNKVPCQPCILPKCEMDQRCTLSISEEQIHESIRQLFLKLRD